MRSLPVRRGRLLLLSLAAHAALGARAPTAPLSPDAPLATDALQIITGAAGADWTVSSEHWSVTAPAAVPGDLITDLQRAGIVSDPWFELNFLNTTTPGHQGAPIWDVGTWTYVASVTPSAPLAAALAAGATASLVFDGIKMTADVYWNNDLIGFANNQFLRFSFALPSVLSTNELRVNFSTSHDVRNAEGRFSGASGGWDWGASALFAMSV